MSSYTPDEYTALLTRTYLPRFPRDCRPRILSDTNDKGEEMLDLLLPHPEDARRSVSMQAKVKDKAVSSCELWFGQVKIDSRLDPDEVISAIEEILSDNIVAVVRYKNRDAFDSSRKCEGAERLYQLPDDAAALDALIRQLQAPATLWDRLGGRTGVFEVYRWSSSVLYER